MADFSTRAGSSGKRGRDEGAQWLVPCTEPYQVRQSFTCFGSGAEEWYPQSGRFAIDDCNSKPQQQKSAIFVSDGGFVNPSICNEDCWTHASGNGLLCKLGAAAAASDGFGVAATWGAGAGEFGAAWQNALGPSTAALAAPRSTKRRKGGADSDNRKYIFPSGTSCWQVRKKIGGTTHQHHLGMYTSLRLAIVGRDASLKEIARHTRKTPDAVVELAKEAGKDAVDRHVGFSWTPPVNDAVYVHGKEWKYHRALTDLIRKYTAAYEIPGLIPPAHASRIKEIFARAYPDATISRNNWKNSRSLAADGRLVVTAPDGSAPGERMSSIFECCNSRLFNGMNNSDNEMAFESTFRTKEACERYCASYFSCIAVRNELVRLLMDQHDIDVVSALSRLEDVMSPAEAEKEVLAVLAQISKDFSKVHEMTAKQLLALIATVVFNESKFSGRVTRRDEDNGRRILGENGMHSKVIAGWLMLAVQKGLGAINERLDLDNDGDPYLDISVPTPEQYLKEDCQGVSYRDRGDPTDYERIVEVGKDLFVGLIFARVVNTNAGKGGSTGYTFTRSDRVMRVFRDIGNDAFRCASTPNFDEWTSGLLGVSLHQLVLCTANAYGGSIHHDAHFKRGGILFGALEEGETWAGKFHIKISRRDRNTIVAEYGEAALAKKCDGDHLLGRNRKELNGLLHCLLLPHVQNIARLWSRKKLNDWLFLFFVGAYAGGNDTPGVLTVRDIFVDSNQ